MDDEVDRSLAAAAAAASASGASLSNPDTRNVESFRRVPTLRVRHAVVPQGRPRAAAPPPTIGRHLPIWYSLPTLAAFRRVRAEAGDACGWAHKPFDFAPMRPGRVHTYKYETESAYYGQYARSLYAITSACAAVLLRSNATHRRAQHRQHGPPPTTPPLVTRSCGRRAGLDCLRHYEILASGAVPFFVGADALSAAPLSMFAFPRALVRAAATLPGVPSEAAVAHALRTDGELRLNRSLFDVGAYCTLRARLLAHTESYLSTVTLAKYVLEQLSRAARASAHPTERATGARRVPPPTRRACVAAPC